MIKDKYSAVWVSFSSIKDYLRCPRAYFLNHIYRNPRTNRKISLIQPSLALGQTIHRVVDSLSVLPVEDRFNIPLLGLYNKEWAKITGKKGGFLSQKTEDEYKKRGKQMIDTMTRNPGPLKRKAIKLSQNLPFFWLSEKDNIILCGKIDWLEYISESDSVHIIDFKTGKYTDNESLQLPIYHLLVSNCQKRKVSRASYWYLNRDTEPIAQNIPDDEKSLAEVKEISKKIALARKLEHFKCKNKSGCSACLPMEKIVQGQAEQVGVNDFNQEVYILQR